MRKWSVGISAMVVMLTGVVAPGAQAATTPHITSVKASNVVFSDNESTTHYLYVTVYDPDNLVYTDPNRYFDVSTVPGSNISNGYAGESYNGKVRTTNGATYDTYRLSRSTWYGWDARGWRHVTAHLLSGYTATDSHYQSYVFKAQSNTEFSRFNATEPVAKGSNTKITGRLIKLEYPWQTDGYQYHSYANKTVTIQFKKAGTTTWVNKGTTTTNSNGEFTKYATADYDGTWRARFGGNSWARARYSPGDYVDVL